MGSRTIESSAEGVLNLVNKTQVAASPLAERLFAIPEISAVFLASGSITITKAARGARITIAEL